MHVLRQSSEDEMVACFLLTSPDLAEPEANRARRDLLAATRGYGENRELFDGDFPTDVRWVWAEPSEADRLRASGVPTDVECLAGIDAALARWAG